MSTQMSEVPMHDASSDSERTPRATSSNSSSFESQLMFYSSENEASSISSMPSFQEFPSLNSMPSIDDTLPPTPIPGSQLAWFGDRSIVDPGMPEMLFGSYDELPSFRPTSSSLFDFENHVGDTPEPIMDPAALEEFQRYIEGMVDEAFSSSFSMDYSADDELSVAASSASDDSFMSTFTSDWEHLGAPIDTSALNHASSMFNDIPVSYSSSTEGYWTAQESFYPSVSTSFTEYEAPMDMSTDMFHAFSTIQNPSLLTPDIDSDCEYVDPALTQSLSATTRTPSPEPDIMSAEESMKLELYDIAVNIAEQMGENGLAPVIAAMFNTEDVVNNFPAFMTFLTGQIRASNKLGVSVLSMPAFAATSITPSNSNIRGWSAPHAIRSESVNHLQHISAPHIRATPLATRPKREYKNDQTVAKPFVGLR